MNQVVVHSLKNSLTINQDVNAPGIKLLIQAKDLPKRGEVSRVYCVYGNLEMTPIQNVYSLRYNSSDAPIYIDVSNHQHDLPTDGASIMSIGEIQPANIQGAEWIMGNVQVVSKLSTGNIVKFIDAFIKAGEGKADIIRPSLTQGGVSQGGASQFGGHQQPSYNSSPNQAFNSVKAPQNEGYGMPSYQPNVQVKSSDNYGQASMPLPATNVYGQVNQGPQQGYNNQGPQQGYINQGQQQGYINQGPQQGYNNQGPQQGYINQGQQNPSMSSMEPPQSVNNSNVQQQDLREDFDQMFGF